MNLGIKQVEFAFLVLMLAVLLPLVPTVIIYWLFPEGSVNISGPLQGLTLKAAGAFAAYVVIFLIGAPFAWSTMSAIRQMVNPPWTIKGSLALVDSNGKAIPNIDEALKGLGVTLSPPIFAAPGGDFWVTVPQSQSSQGIPELTISVPGFINDTLELNGKLLQINGVSTHEDLAADTDQGNRQIWLKTAITLQQDRAPGSYNANPADSAALSPAASPQTVPR